jgi:transketolase
VRDAFIARLTRIAEADPRVLLITGDLGFGVLTRFAAEKPVQFLNAGVAEANMTGLATGLALSGRVVFTYSIANFPTLRCLEQLRNDAAYHEANVKAVAIGGGFSYGALGMSHHATEDLAILRAIPGITLLSPGCLWEAEEATDAIARTPGVCYLRLDKSSAGRTNRVGELFALGRIRTLREGSDVTLVATGGILGVALKAAEQLAEQGIQARVLSVHTLRPFDTETVFAACRETGGIITVEEHVVDGGLGGLVAETCLEAGVIPRVFHRIGMRAGFSSIVGSQDYLRQRYGMDAPTIVRRAMEMLGGVDRAPGALRVVR